MTCQNDQFRPQKGGNQTAGLSASGACMSWPRPRHEPYPPSPWACPKCDGGYALTHVSTVVKELQGRIATLEAAPAAGAARGWDRPAEGEEEAE